MVDSTRAVLMDTGCDPLVVDRYVKAWLAGYRSEATRKTYWTGITKWLAWCRAHGLNPLEIVKTTVDLYLRHLESVELSDNSRSTYLTSVRSWYQWLFDEQIIGGNPAARVLSRRVDLPDGLSWADQYQVRHMLHEAPKVLNPDEHAAFCAMALCALRAGEVTRADIADLTTRRWVPQLKVHGKGFRERVIDIPPKAMEAFEAVGRDVGPLVTNRDGRRMARYSLARIVTKTAKAARLEHLGLTPHAMRRSWVSIALDLGVPLRDVQMYVGHAHSSTTERYDRRQDLTMRSPSWAVMQAVA